MGRTQAGRWWCGECGGKGAEGGSSQLQDTAVLRQDSRGRGLADAAAVQSAGRWQFTKLIGNFRRLTGPTGKELAGWQRQRHSQDEAAITSTSLYTPARDEGTRGRGDELSALKGPRDRQIWSQCSRMQHPRRIFWKFPCRSWARQQGRGDAGPHPPTSHFPPSWPARPFTSTSTLSLTPFPNSTSWKAYGTR